MSIQNSWSLHIHLLLGWSEKPSLGERVKQTSVALTRTHQAYLVPLQVLRASHVWVLPQGSNELQGCHNDMWIQFEIGSWTMDASVSFISPLELYTAWVKHIQILLFQSEMHTLLYCFIVSITIHQQSMENIQHRVDMAPHTFTTRCFETFLSGC